MGGIACSSMYVEVSACIQFPFGGMTAVLRIGFVLRVTPLVPLVRGDQQLLASEKDGNLNLPLSPPALPTEALANTFPAIYLGSMLWAGRCSL